MAALDSRRSDDRVRLAEVNERLVGATAELRTAGDRLEAARQAHADAEAEAAPKGEHALKAKEAKLDELKAAMSEAEKAHAAAAKQIKGLHADLDESLAAAARTEQDWQTASAAADPATAPRIGLSSRLSMIAPFNCHEDHYAGVCGCCCDGDCDGWVVLAKIAPPNPLVNGPLDPGAVDYGVRRFIRPVLATDPYWQDPPTAGA
jgi:hypothetical protein